MSATKDKKIRRVKKAGKDSPSVGSPLTVGIELCDYWYESITREEAYRRLATRNLEPKRRARIKKMIPDQIQHFLTFDGGFREYMDDGFGPARLLLALPMKRTNKQAVEVGCPMLHAERLSSGGVRYFSTFELHEFKFVGKKLFETGAHRKTFRFAKGPLGMQLDVSFAQPGPGHPGGSSCCDYCEIVHSVLDIHDLDWLCCLGGCGLINIPA